VRIERTEGSCGTFEGPDALARYSEVARKTKWREENETAEAIKPLVFDKGFSAPCGTPDDLAKALGISEAFAAKLNGAGVFHVWQIRQFTMDDMHALDIKLSAKGRVLNSGWNSGSLPED
jgi:predicted flap endonuclease-1-like 5' DNA nuclease